MAHVICASLAEPSPYPWCEVRGGPSYGWLGLVENIKGERVLPEPQPMWASKDGGAVPSEWRPKSVLRADDVPENNRAPYNPDISFVKGGAPCLTLRRARPSRVWSRACISGFPSISLTPTEPSANHGATCSMFVNSSMRSRMDIIILLGMVLVLTTRVHSIR